MDNGVSILINLRIHLLSSKIKIKFQIITIVMQFLVEYLVNFQYKSSSTVH